MGSGQFRIHYWTDARQHGIYLFYIVTKSLFISKYFNITRKPAIAPPLPTLAKTKKKKPLDVIYYLYRMKRFHWLLWVVNNCDWSRKIAPLSKKTRGVAPCGMKTYSESRIELQKFKSFEESARKIKSVFVIRAARWAEKAGTLPRKTCGCGKPRGHLIRVLSEWRANDCGEFCLLWLVILNLVWYSVGGTF